MKVLFVIDMQNDFIDGALGTKEAQAIVKNVANKILEHKNDCVVATYDTHYEDYLETLEGKKLPVEHCIYKRHGWELNAEIEKALGQCKKVIRKMKKTFGYIEHDDALRGTLGSLKEIDEIEVCGLCTDICVVSNALILRALFPNTKITVDSTCCAGVTPETHISALTTMKMCQIKIK